MKNIYKTHVNEIKIDRYELGKDYTLEEVLFELPYNPDVEKTKATNCNPNCGGNCGGSCCPCG